MPALIEADYIIIGAGAVGLAFADIILSESQFTVAIIDRNARPGGHWNDAYDFVTLHQPSAFYGINSLPLGEDKLDTTGPNAGLYELASGGQVRAYFEQVISDIFLPTGRCQYLSRHEYLGESRLKCLTTGAEQNFVAHRKVVDATYFGTNVPSRHHPSFSIDPTQTLVAPNALSGIFPDTAPLWPHVCIVGAGKTAMDVAGWLLAQGQSPETISWVVPRDSWLLNRKYTQPGMDFFEGTIGKQAEQMQLIGSAQSAEDLFLKLEQAGIMMRIDQSVMPTMYHCATMSEAETEALQSIKNILRQGRVSAITEQGLTFQTGHSVHMPSQTLYIDCTASAVDRRPAKPVFQAQLITPQMVRTCQPTFSAALIAHIELSVPDEARRNQLTSVPPLPHGLNEFLHLTIVNLMNQYLWSREVELRNWILNCRLDGFSKTIAAARPDDETKQSILKKFREFTPQAVGNLHTLMAQA